MVAPTNISSVILMPLVCFTTKNNPKLKTSGTESEEEKVDS